MIDLGGASDVILTDEVRESLLGASGKGYVTLKRETLEKMASFSSGCDHDWIWCLKLL